MGSTFIYGKGDATGVVADLNNLAVDYTRTQATSRTVYLHITGATRAAADLGDRTATGIKKRGREKEEGSGGRGAAGARGRGSRAERRARGNRLAIAYHGTTGPAELCGWWRSTLALESIPL